MEFKNSTNELNLKSRHCTPIPNNSSKFVIVKEIFYSLTPQNWQPKVSKNIKVLKKFWLTSQKMFRIKM